jgi:hypothetical protein
MHNIDNNIICKFKQSTINLKVCLVKKTFKILRNLNLLTISGMLNQET